jgi:DNA-binding MarR family transcriptional regulator
LGEKLLQSPFTLTQARVLFELGARKGASAGEIGAALGLDLGYLSRIVQAFSSRGLITRKRSSNDGRRIVLSLTARGRKAFHAIDKKSRDEGLRDAGPIAERAPYPLAGRAARCAGHSVGGIARVGAEPRHSHPPHRRHRLGDRAPCAALCRGVSLERGIRGVGREALCPIRE